MPSAKCQPFFLSLNMLTFVQVIAYSLPCQTIAGLNIKASPHARGMLILSQGM